MNLRITILGFIIFASAGCQTNLLQNALTGTSDNATEDAVVTTMSMTQMPFTVLLRLGEKLSLRMIPDMETPHSMEKWGAWMSEYSGGQILCKRVVE